MFVEDDEDTVVVELYAQQFNGLPDMPVKMKS
jgi:hypothetical protein